jgi:spermidine synthase
MKQPIPSLSVGPNGPALEVTPGEEAVADHGAAPPAGMFALQPLFTMTSLVSATLLFLLQPMVAKMILPKFGGAPAVWSTCMVFFQATLLAGYAYAHLTTRWLGVRRQALAHLGLMLLPLLTLPITVSAEWAPPGDADPTSRLLGLLLALVGISFFAVSTSAPLLQAWFAASGHVHARDPYFLYGASNVGSLLALLAYPVLIEPYITLRGQGWLWAGGYLVLALLIAACAMSVWRSPSPHRDDAEGSNSKTASFGPWTRAHWVVLAFVPSSMMLGVTTFLSSDITPIPLLWIVPLSLYLLSFILVFRRRPSPWLRKAAVRALPALILIEVFLSLSKAYNAMALLIVVHLLTFFVAALVCHGELARSRPPAEFLTEFYFWMSLGGVLGGLFNALIAPLLFTTLAEYPLSMVLAAFLIPRLVPGRSRPLSRWLDFLLPLALAVVAGVLLVRRHSVGLPLCYGILSLLCLALSARPIRFGLGLAALMLIGGYLSDDEGLVVHRERNFFGVLAVTRGSSNLTYRLSHGGILHGAQNRSNDPRLRRLPLLYFFPTGPIGEVFAAFRNDPTKRRVGVVGLGVGSLASYGEPGQEFTFFEIDPAVVRIASDPTYFTFLRDSRALTKVVLGDARLSLQRMPDHYFGMIVIDAFSGDAIPMHLLTREAIQLYFRKLSDDGLIVFHITNKYLDLREVVANLALTEGAVALHWYDSPVNLQEKVQGKFTSRWVVMARRERDLGKLADTPHWSPLIGRDEASAWTDDYSNLLRSMY